MLVVRGPPDEDYRRVLHAEDTHLLESLPLSHARCVISTVPLPEACKALVHGLRHHGYRGKVVLTAHSPRDAEQLDQAGADVVLKPYPLAAETAVAVLDQLLRSDGNEEDTDARA